MLTQLKGVLFLHMPKWRERIEKIQNGILDNSNNNYIIFLFLVLLSLCGISSYCRYSDKLKKEQT